MEFYHIIGNNNDMSSVVCLHCHCFTMQCMWYVCDTFLLLPLECPAYLLVVISQISCFHCMRQQQRQHAAPGAVSPDNTGHQSGVERFKTCNCPQFSPFSSCIFNSAANRSIGSTSGCTITENAPTRAFSWLKATTTAFTLKNLLRHC